MELNRVLGLGYASEAIHKETGSDNNHGFRVCLKNEKGKQLVVNT